MRRGETRQAAKTHSVQDDPGDPFAADDSVGAQAQIGSDTPDGERDADQPSNQLRVKSGDSQPTDQTAGTEQSVPRFADPFGSPEQPPLHEGIVPHQPILRLSHHEPVPANASEVGALEPYTEWTPTGFVPDPRTARPVDLTTLLAEVVEHEGPVVAVRAYRLINRASGSKRLTLPARRTLNRACAAAVRKGLVAAASPLVLDGQAQLVLRSPESPEVIPRERGPRQLDELPPDEIAALLRSLRGTIGPMDAEVLKRQALERLGWVRLTRNVSEFLDQCIALM